MTAASVTVACDDWHQVWFNGADLGFAGDWANSRSYDVTGRVKAGDLANFVAGQVGGKGGGKADMAMAGGTDPSRLAEALASVPAWVGERA